jgi:hypothetical protein
MAWTTPRTWIPYELVTDTMLNTHVRDNLNATSRQLAEFLNTGGVGNSLGSTNQSLYTFIVPSGLMSVDGDTLIIDSWYMTAANANPKTAVYALGGLPGYFAHNGGPTASNATIWLRAELRRYTSVIAWSNTIATQGNGQMVAQSYAFNMSPGWASNQQFDIIVNCPAPNDIKLYSVRIEFKRGI